MRTRSSCRWEDVKANPALTYGNSERFAACNAVFWGGEGGARKELLGGSRGRPSLRLPCGRSGFEHTSEQEADYRKGNPESNAEYATDICSDGNLANPYVRAVDGAYHANRRKQQSRKRIIVACPGYCGQTVLLENCLHVLKRRQDTRVLVQFLHKREFHTMLEPDLEQRTDDAVDDDNEDECAGKRDKQCGHRELPIANFQRI